MTTNPYVVILKVAKNDSAVVLASINLSVSTQDRRPDNKTLCVSTLGSGAIVQHISVGWSRSPITR
jgi:hypothetical protein